MLEVTGDSTRGGEWACARLVVDGDRIVEADAEGLERPLVGLTLLEAAAVRGDRLAVDALANAIGPIFRAEPDEARIAVAMSGGAGPDPTSGRAGLPRVVRVAGGVFRISTSAGSSPSRRRTATPRMCVASG